MSRARARRDEFAAGGRPACVPVSASAGERGAAGFLSLVASRAERWLLEPAPPRPRAAEPPPDARPVVAVIGLGPRCGTTTIARALAIELARRDRSGAAIVSACNRGPAPALATAAARRLARALPREAASAAGRLCLLDPDDAAIRELALSRPAPLVLDVEHGRPPQGPFALADAAVLVAGVAIEPALADVVAASLTRGGLAPLIVLNRAAELSAWSERDVLMIGEARLGARLALAGRDPTPGLARPIGQLADALVGEEVA
ncbi:MAG: hypothetical protein QOH76_976 [Thermoleophilaceae bacterium]|jgi:hypothetical protein|nr:hypothetical protein [Thermoleophilaceae bacterium]